MVVGHWSRREAVEGGHSQFPSRYGPETPSFTLDADWLADAELAILEARPAGDVDRTITIGGFSIPSR